MSAGPAEAGGYTEEQAAELRASAAYAGWRARYPDLFDDRLGLDYADRVLGMTCGRCGRRTGNNTQGHRWAYCTVTLTMREHHFCCPGACELEVGLEMGQVRP